uniref:Uncharacterized protein n=1 Tax=Anguilla anguilla TaxID=7936 RepID=A0A0E9WSB4_ANGAN
MRCRKRECGREMSVSRSAIDPRQAERAGLQKLHSEPGCLTTPQSTSANTHSSPPQTLSIHHKLRLVETAKGRYKSGAACGRVCTW